MLPSFMIVDNFLRLLTDDKFHNALINTAVFCVAGAILAGAVSLVRRLRNA